MAKSKQINVSVSLDWYEHLKIEAEKLGKELKCKFTVIDMVRIAIQCHYKNGPKEEM